MAAGYQFLQDHSGLSQDLHLLLCVRAITHPAFSMDAVIQSIRNLLSIVSYLHSLYIASIYDFTGINRQLLTSFYTLTEHHISDPPIH